MNIITGIRERVEQLAIFAELDVPADVLPVSAARLSDASVVEAMRMLAAVANDVSRVQAVLAGVAAARSRREDGQSGLAAVEGHASPASLIQSITGGSKADAQRQVRVGTAMVEEAPAPAPSDNDQDATPPLAVLWHEPLRVALMGGDLTTVQHDAIRRGLGAPIVTGVDDGLTARAWSLAAEQLIGEAAVLSVEDLAARARTVRDVLDPTGAEERFARRYEARSLRMWVDEYGQRRGRLVFDDEMAEWIDAIFASALRPRRGGPRFMTDEEQAQAKTLSEDTRSNEQLQYDLFMDLVRAGALASAEDVFGVRQAGVRLVVVKDAVGPRDAFGRILTTGHTVDGGRAVPGSLIDRALCATGHVDVTVDTCGNPLDVGREQRLFTPAQKIALAIRDGGCMWPDCPRPASYCEAHHVDHYADGGRTDTDRGVLLCLFHHLLLHNKGWKITRDGKGPFFLHPPGGGADDAMILSSKAAWKWSWDPPPRPQRPGWRTAA